MGNELRDDFVAWQDQWLRPGALRVADSGGRTHPEQEHPFRTCYQRDRDRIVHCAAFRRLDYKTQVFVPHERDHYRTRLTHSLEVAQVARTLARALRANEDAAEAVALAHDLGHPPFGHAGERVLDELMSGHGRFEHNRQTLRVVDHLEHPYPRFRGLNLTGAVRRCLIKHQGPYDAPAAGEFDDGLLPPLEGQLVDLSDEIAYTSADLYDAIEAGWIEPDQLTALALWRQALERSAPTAGRLRPVHARIQACRSVLDMMVEDAVSETEGRLDALGPASAADVQSARQRCAAFSEALAGAVDELQRFLLKHVYEHPQVRRDHDQARRIIRELFGAYVESPSLLLERYRRRISAEGLHRVVCDYVAGMTDRFCQAEHRNVVAEEKGEEKGSGTFSAEDLPQPNRPFRKEQPGTEKDRRKGS